MCPPFPGYRPSLPPHFLVPSPRRHPDRHLGWREHRANNHGCCHQLTQAETSSVRTIGGDLRASLQHHCKRKRLSWLPFWRTRPPPRALPLLFERKAHRIVDCPVDANFRNVRSRNLLQSCANKAAIATIRKMIDTVSNSTKPVMMTIAGKWLALPLAPAARSLYRLGRAEVSLKQHRIRLQGSGWC